MNEWKYMVVLVLGLLCSEVFAFQMEASCDYSNTLSDEACPPRPSGVRDMIIWVDNTTGLGYNSYRIFADGTEVANKEVFPLIVDVIGEIEPYTTVKLSSDVLNASTPGAYVTVGVYVNMYGYEGEQKTLRGKVCITKGKSVEEISTAEIYTRLCKNIRIKLDDSLDPEDMYPGTDKVVGSTESGDEANVITTEEYKASLQDENKIQANPLTVSASD